MNFLLYYFIFAPCAFHTITGFYCPGCGGRRSISYFLQGDFYHSFLAHPLVLFLFFSALLGIVLFCLKKRNPTLSFSSLGKVWLFLMIAIITINFLVKNIALLVFQVDLLANLTKYP